MTRQNRVIRIGAILMMAFMLMAPAIDGLAIPFRPAAALSLLSEYTVNSAAPPHTQVWKVVPEATSPDGSMTLRFFQEAAPDSGTVCVLFLPPAGSGGSIRWQGSGSEAEKSSDTGLLLTPGFPVPDDILPVGEKEDGRVYQETVTAGGSRFSRSYRVSVESFSVTEAREKGWIRSDAPGLANLTMITATDEKGRLALRQLWAADGSWWLYEETPLRRSWLVY